jgi:CheY-like chemotaxis protein
MKPARRRTVLVVDDDPYIIGLVCALLSRFDFDILSAEDPAEALRIAQQGTTAVDLLVTDIHMPGMTGLELTKKIRERRPNVKVIYMSGDPDAQTLFLEKDEPSFFLRKPFKLEELEKIVRPLSARTAAAESGYM